jgi:succinate-semialdehyde dehydrogenase/glutarate-semialdehyde dehydrogenase
VLADVPLEAKVMSEEPFGPLALMRPFKDLDEAIEQANRLPFGLAAYFYTENLKRSWRVGEALEFGMIGLNTGAISTEVAPFGGVKQSGLGREGAQVGIEEYLEMKSFHIGGLS